LNKGDLQKFWGDVLGLTKVTSFKSEKENVDEDVMECGRGILGKVEVDLMTPLDPEKSPKVHIPPLNHVGLWVDDLPKCVEHLESILILQLLTFIENGIKIVGGIRKGASGYDVTFIHPKSACGVLLELVQAPKEVIEAYNSAKN
jgi:lactoylglutathione lyase